MNAGRAWVQYVAPDKRARDAYHRVPAHVTRGRVRMWVWKPLCGAASRKDWRDTARVSVDKPARGAVCSTCLELEAQPRSRA